MRPKGIFFHRPRAKRRAKRISSNGDLCLLRLWDTLTPPGVVGNRRMPATFNLTGRKCGIRCLLARCLPLAAPPVFQRAGLPGVQTVMQPDGSMTPLVRFDGHAGPGTYHRAAGPGWKSGRADMLPQILPKIHCR